MININKLKNNRYITGFDGIRTLAVIGVILYHLFPKWMSGGYLGVPIFFVLSGYLITDLLRKEWLQTEKIDIKGFYYRRMKRLYPALIMMLVLSIGYILFFQPNLLSGIRSEVISSLLYYNNWWQIFKGFSYFDGFATQSPFTHIWSLAVETQYYLIWPLLFVFFKKYLKKPLYIFASILVLALFSSTLMAVLYVQGADPTRVYYGTDTRIFSILLGSALAFVWPSYRLKEEVPDKVRIFLNSIGVVSFVVIICSFVFLAYHYMIVYRGGMLIVSFFATILIAITAHPGSDLNRWLTNPVFTWMGKRSYGIYLYQFPVMVLYEAKIQNLNDYLFLHSFIELLIILGLSELSYRFIEQPLLQFDYRFSKERVKAFFRNPWFTAEKITSVVSLIFIGLATYGFIVAPSEQVDGDQEQLQKTIEANKKAAEKRKEQEKTGESIESPPDVDETKYQLTKEETQKAKTMEITAIGDSVLLDAGAELQQIFPKMLIDGEVGRQLYEGPEIIEKQKKEKSLKPNILVSLGTNGSFTEIQFDEFMKAIGADHQVYWVNVYVPTRRWQNEVNDMLKKMAKKYNNLKVIDWFSYSKQNTAWFYEDQVHPNEEGKIKYTSFIAKHIVEETKKKK